jgi:FkbM family methyltransferase
MAEMVRLTELPRYVETTTNLVGFEVTIPDGPSFVAAWTEIFHNRIYDFSTNNSSPRILDCGANVGLSCLFFKQRFPDCRLTAFEPDPKIFAYLSQFVASAKLPAIELVAKGIWSSVTSLKFFSEGADSGRICMGGRAPNMIEIQTVRLRDYLCEPIDLLKIDVEGAETEVIIDCADKLEYVSRLFVEYHSFIAQPQTLDQILTVLRRAGFRVQIHEFSKAEKPFLGISEHLGMDLQLNIFAYRP